MLKKPMQFFRKRFSTRTSAYLVGGFEIQIPQGHALPLYQAAHRLYDRFIIILGETLPDGALIVDVGANVGDSAAALCCARQRRIICIEPGKTFYSMLERNVGALRSRGHEVTCLKKIIGVPGSRGDINEGVTSGQLILGDDGIEVQALDDVLAPIIPSTSDLILLKSDTDGNDADVISSARSAIYQSEPLLFWENEVKTASSLEAYYSAFRLLNEVGYDKFSIFDNFGNLMFETGTVESLIDISKYIYSMSTTHSTRTLYYADIFASTTKHRQLHNYSIDLFKSRYLSNP